MTHPFHPLCGRDFEFVVFVVYRQNWARSGSTFATRALHAEISSVPVKRYAAALVKEAAEAVTSGT